MVLVVIGDSVVLEFVECCFVGVGYVELDMGLIVFY